MVSLDPTKAAGTMVSANGPSLLTADMALGPFRLGAHPRFCRSDDQGVECLADTRFQLTHELERIVVRFHDTPQRRPELETQGIELGEHVADAEAIFEPRPPVGGRQIGRALDWPRIHGWIGGRDRVERDRQDARDAALDL